jgi:hypothetical protein
MALAALLPDRFILRRAGVLRGCLMYVELAAFVFALGAGLVSAGLIGSLWGIVANEELNLQALERLDLVSPLRGVAYVLSRPSAWMGQGLTTMVSYPFYSMMALAAGGSLAFLQGVVVMTQIFGVK